MIQVRPSDTCVYSFRLPKAEMERMEEAAARERIKLAEYVRRAVRLCVGGGLPLAPAINWCVSTPYLNVQEATVWTETASRMTVDLTVRYT